MRKNNSKKKITLDDLAAMTQRGFGEVSGQFKETNERIDNFEKNMNHRFDIIENKLIAQHAREIEQLRDKVMQHEVKLAKLSK